MPARAKPGVPEGRRASAPSGFAVPGAAVNQLLTKLNPARCATAIAARRSLAPPKVAAPRPTGNLDAPSGAGLLRRIDRQLADAGSPLRRAERAEALARRWAHSLSAAAALPKVSGVAARSCP